MHELSIVESMVKTADAFCKERDIKSARQLTVQVGALTGVIPSYLTMYYAEVAKGTALEGSELVIEEIAAEAFCKCCGCVFDPAATHGVCPDCGKNKTEMLHGNELTIKELGYM